MRCKDRAGEPRIALLGKDITIVSLFLYFSSDLKMSEPSDQQSEPSYQQSEPSDQQSTLQENETDESSPEKIDQIRKKESV